MSELWNLARYVHLENKPVLYCQTSTLVLITNYTSEIEYLIDPTAEKCEKYGPDAMYPWGYGMGGMTFDGVHVVSLLSTTHEQRVNFSRKAIGSS